MTIVESHKGRDFPNMHTFVNKYIKQFLQDQLTFFLTQSNVPIQVTIFIAHNAINKSPFLFDGNQLLAPYSHFKQLQPNETVVKIRLKQINAYRLANYMCRHLFMQNWEKIKKINKRTLYVLLVSQDLLDLWISQIQNTVIHRFSCGKFYSSRERWGRVLDWTSCYVPLPQL